VAELADLHSYEVGKPYIPGRTRWQEAGEYNYRGGAHELRLFFGRLGDREIRDVRQREAEFALFVEQPVILFLYRFGASIPWSDAPYSWWLVSPEQRTLPEPVGQAEETRDLLTTILIDADSGIIRAIRVVSLSPAFTTALHLAIREQASRPWDPTEYDARLAALYRRYPTSRALLKAATSRTLGGR